MLALEMAKNRDQLGNPTLGNRVWATFTFFIGNGQRMEPALCQLYRRTVIGKCWWRGTVVERRFLTGELSLSCARPAADG